jgi:ligand-binding SRPBCC domain-containing protein
MAVVRLSFSTRVAASAPDVWAVVSTMDGVNAELRPLMRMTHPPHLTSLADADIVLGELAMHSWLLAFGFLPIDRHALGLERVYDGEGFDEESTSWLQRRWRHERRVIDEGDGTSTVTDELTAEPRLGLLAPVLRRVVTALFRHRHRQLARRFGSVDGT